MQLNSYLLYTLLWTKESGKITRISIHNKHPCGIIWEIKRIMNNVQQRLIHKSYAALSSPNDEPESVTKQIHLSQTFSTLYPPHKPKENTTNTYTLDKPPTLIWNATPENQLRNLPQIKDSLNRILYIIYSI